MKEKMLVGMLIGLLMVTSINAMNLNLLEEKQDKSITVGVHLDEDYYTVIIKDNKIKKFEYHGQEQTDYELYATKVKVIELLMNYQSMSKIEIIRFINENFEIPHILMMKLAGEYMSNAN